MKAEVVEVGAKDMADLRPFLGAVADMIPFLNAVPGLPEDIIVDLELATADVWKKANGRTVAGEAFDSLVDAACRVEKVLTEKISKEEAALVHLREDLAEELLLLDTEDLRRLERHRRLLETSLKRQLECLGLIRAQVQVARPEDQGKAEEYKVRLRLVK